MELEFNLVDEPWIPLIRDGTRVLAGIRQALLEAHAFAGLAPDAPMQEPAILRQVLLPAVLAALEPCRDHDAWADRFDQPDGFSAAEQDVLNTYLDKHRDRFDLFNPVAPFAQAAGLQALNRQTKSAALLIADAPSGNNVPLFAAATEADLVELTAPQAAAWMLSALCFDTAAIKTGAAGDEQAKGGKTLGNPTGPLGRLGLTYPLGRTLYETLLLNTPITAGRAESDAPAWERMAPGAQWTTRPVDGILDLLTWPSRRIRLIPEQTPDGIRVSRVVLAGGDRMAALPEDEPHTLWRRDLKAKGADASWRPRRHRAGQPAWRGLAALLAVSPGAGGQVGTTALLRQLSELRVEECIDAGYPLQVRTIAVEYGVQAAVVEDIATDHIPLPVTALLADGRTHHEVLEIAEQAGRLARAVDRLDGDLRRACGGDPVPWDGGEHPGDRLLHALDPLVRRVLAGMQRHAADEQAITAGVQAWQQAAFNAASAIGRQLLDAAAPAAFAGREADGRTYRESTAEDSFGREVAKTLPLAVPPDETGDGHVTHIDHRGRWFWEEFNPHRNSAGADLAALRRGLNKIPGDMPEMWPHYRAVLPEPEWAEGGAPPAALVAEHAALVIFGIHQQSLDRRMHRGGVGLGEALRWLRRSGKYSEDAVNARVQAMATSGEVAELTEHLRQLVSQLNATGQPLDYSRLVADLFAWHDPARRPAVRRAWGGQYHRWSAGGDKAKPDRPDTDS